MSGRIDFARDGAVLVQCDPAIPKHKRGEALTTFGIATPETVPGTQDYGGRNKMEAANALVLSSDPARNAPRGTASSLAMGGAVAVRENGRYRVLEGLGANDLDYLPVSATAIVNGRPGNPPDGTIAYLVATTRHGAPEVLALHSGGGGGPGGGDIIAQHEGNGPNQYSSRVADIAGDSVNPNRTAGLDSIFRVRSMRDPLCQPKTISSDPPGPNSVFLNGTRATGEATGWLPVTFSTFDALGSHERNGPLRPATARHLFGLTRDKRPLVPLALDPGLYWTRGDPNHDSPLEMLDEDEPEEIADEGFPHRGRIMTDRDYEGPLHTFMCDKMKTLRRIHVRVPVVGKPTCRASQPAAADNVDENDNPQRTFSPGPEVYAPTAYQGTGLRLMPRPGVLSGKPTFGGQL